jgi:hypothetical protein
MIIRKFGIITGRGKKKRVVNVGELDDKKVFRKFVKSSIHLLQKYNSYGISEQIVKELEKEKCHIIEIYDVESLTKWVVPFEIFLKKGWVWAYGNFEPQRFLEKNKWDIFNNKGEQLQKRKKDSDDNEEFYTPQKKLF